MHYAVVGRVSVEMCEDCSAFGAEGFLRFYQGGHFATLPQAGQGLHQIISEQEFAQWGSRYLAREPLDSNGMYEVGIDDRQHDYQGGTLLAVLELPFVAPMRGPEAAHPMLFVILETLQPQWTPRGRTAYWEWDTRIPSATWYSVIGRFDVGCIAGQLREQNSRTALAGINLKAKNVEDTRECFLGEAITDAEGRFNLFYCMEDARKRIWAQQETADSEPFEPALQFEVDAEGTIAILGIQAEQQHLESHSRPHCWKVDLLLQR